MAVKGKDREAFQVVRGAIFQGKVSSLDISTIFKHKNDFEQLKRGVSESVQRISGTALAYFDRISQQRIDHFKKVYPKTVRALFMTAYQVIQGAYGEKFQLEARSISGSILESENILSLLLRNNPTGPEIFLSNINKNNLDLKVLVQIFRIFLINLSNPSHLTINLLLEYHSIEEAIKATLEIKSEIEKSKSFEVIIERLLESGDIERAKELANAIKAKQEKEKALVSIVDKLLSMHKVSETLKYVESREDTHEIETMLTEMVYILVSHELIILALGIVEKFESSEKRDYVLSSVVKKLVFNKQFFVASKIIANINDAGFKEDANAYLITGWLDDRQFEKAIRYVEGIEQPREKIRAAKVILNAMIAIHATDKVQEVCTKFKLVKYWTKLD